MRVQGTWEHSRAARLMHAPLCLAFTSWALAWFLSRRLLASPRMVALLLKAARLVKPKCESAHSCTTEGKLASWLVPTFLVFESPGVSTSGGLIKAQ